MQNLFYKTFIVYNKPLIGKTKLIHDLIIINNSITFEEYWNMIEKDMINQYSNIDNIYFKQFYIDVWSLDRLNDKIK